MKPKEFIRDLGVDIVGGYNSSLLRAENEDCIIAYKKMLDIDFLIIKTASSGYKMYKLVFFENENIKAELIRKKVGIYLKKLKWNVLIKKDFDRFIKSIILEKLK